MCVLVLGDGCRQSTTSVDSQEQLLFAVNVCWVLKTRTIVRNKFRLPIMVENVCRESKRVLEIKNNDGRVTDG